MPKNIIITCGTSLTENLKDENLFNSDELSILESLSKKIQSEENLNIENKIKKYLENNNVNKLSAELTIIYKLLEKNNITKKDSIFLYTSETELGKRLWKIIKDILEKDWFENINYNFIKWFVVENIWIGEESKAYKVFQNKAIKNYFEQLEKIKENAQKNNEKTIMCPVWWYKALIPYSSLYAMVQGWEIKYIYEDSDEIIDLPSWSLTNLSAERILNEKIDVKEIFSNENLSNNYSFDIGLKLIFWIKNFIDYWKSKDLSKIFERIEKVLVEKKQFDEEKKSIWNLKKYLENLSDAFDLIRLKDIKNNILKIKKVKINNFKDPLLKKFILFLQKELDKVDLNNIITWYFERWRYAEAILIMREWIIDFVWQRLNIPYIDRENRLKIEASLKLVWNKLKPYNKKIKKDKSRYNYLDEHLEQDLFKLFYWYENFWDELADKRNNFAHTNQGISLKVMKKWIINLYKTYKEITSSKSTF